MYTPTQLEAIKLFGRKDLTEGCISIEKDWTLWKCDISKEWRTINLPEWQRNVTSSKMEWEILWHIPQLSPDLFRVFWNRWDIIEVKYPEIIADINDIDILEINNKNYFIDKKNNIYQITDEQDIGIFLGIYDKTDNKIIYMK